jgi:hypothetical protein
MLLLPMAPHLTGMLLCVVLLYDCSTPNVPGIHTEEQVRSITSGCGTHTSSSQAILLATPRPGQVTSLSLSMIMLQLQMQHNPQACKA